MINWFISKSSDDGQGLPTSMIEEFNPIMCWASTIMSTAAPGCGPLLRANVLPSVISATVQQGHIQLLNGGPLNGGEFRIYLGRKPHS